MITVVPVDCPDGYVWPNSPSGMPENVSLTHVGDDVVYVPMTEEAVVHVAFANGKHGLGPKACRNAVFRPNQREALEPLGVNPAWGEMVNPGPDTVIKRFRSTLSRGVLLPNGSGGLIWEEHIEGPQYEVSAVVGKGGELLTWFRVLHQTWSPDGRRIERYGRERELLLMPNRKPLPEWLTDIAKALGLEYCGMNVEFRTRADKAYVIEVHARLGEDPRPEYVQAWSPEECPYLKCLQLIAEDLND